MAVKLVDIDDRPPPAGVTLRAVGDRMDLRQWNDIGVETFEMPALAAAPSLAMHAALVPGSDATHWPYLAERDGEPLAMAALTLFAGVVCLQTLATRVAARNQGLGTALTRYLMMEGRRRGFEVGVLQASTQGRSVYEKLGFREICGIDEYLLDADSNQPGGDLA